MNATRRNFFKLAGGSAVGLLFTPVPYKTLADVSIWSQNWSWIPVPLKGERKVKFANCTLCTAGCGVKVQCIGDQPIALTGAAGHPSSDGALCPFGLAGHQLPYHPQRVTQALCQARPVAIDQAVEAVKKAIGNAETVAIFDERPGRTASRIYRSFANGLPHGIYLAPPSHEAATLDALRALLQVPADVELGLDLENTRTLLSFGAPILNGWGTPGRMMKLQPRMRLIQVESRQSPTAALADTWLPAKPGSEAALALGLGNLIAEASGRKDYPVFPVERAAALTGLSVGRIREVAALLMEAKPALALGGGDPYGGSLGRETESAIASLNLLLGSIDVPGGIVARRRNGEDGNGTPLSAVPDHSIGVLLIDSPGEGVIPWSTLRRKLVRENPLVVSMSPYRGGYAAYAHYVIPAPVYLESLQDIPAPPDACAARLSLSAPLLKAPETTIEPADFVARLAGAASLAEQMKTRVAQIHKVGRGNLFTYADAKTTPVKEVASADDLWKALSEGGCWTDVPAPVKLPSKWSLAVWESTPGAPGNSDFPLTAILYGWRGSGQGSTVMTKLDQESALHALDRQAAMHPETAASCGVKDGEAATFSTPRGSCRISLMVDEAVMPGVVYVTLAAGADLFAGPDESQWRLAAARVRKA